MLECTLGKAVLPGHLQNVIDTWSIYSATVDRGLVQDVFTIEPENVTAESLVRFGTPSYVTDWYLETAEPSQDDVEKYNKSGYPFPMNYDAYLIAMKNLPDLREKAPLLNSAFNDVFSGSHGNWTIKAVDFIGAVLGKMRDDPENFDTRLSRDYIGATMGALHYAAENMFLPAYIRKAISDWSPYDPDNYRSNLYNASSIGSLRWVDLQKMRHRNRPLYNVMISSGMPTTQLDYYPGRVRFNDLSTLNGYRQKKILVDIKKNFNNLRNWEEDANNLHYGKFSKNNTKAVWPRKNTYNFWSYFT